MDYPSLIASLIGGGLAGGIVSHFLAKGREDYARKYASAIARESRKSDFLSFLRGWRIEIMRERLDETSAHFSSRVRDFEEAVERISTDYSDDSKASLEVLVSQVSLMENRDVEIYEGREKLLEAMDMVRDFVKKN